jgi:hypothetical protein
MQPNPSRRDLFKAGGALAAGAMFGGVAHGQGGLTVEREITADKVRAAIEQGITYLKEQQLSDGSWPDQPHYGGGLTALCTLALLHAGCAIDDAVIARALNQLRGMEPTTTYATSLQTQVFCAATPTADKLLIHRNVKWLESRQIKRGEFAGMWAIPTTKELDHTDNSMTHFAMLGLYEAERVGVSAADDTWRLALKYWQSAQLPDGSWGWGPNNPGSGSMTCAGIAALIIASGQLGNRDAGVDGDSLRCCREQQQNPYIERALAWLTRNFSVHGNPNVDYWFSYYLYSMERACRMTARRFVGEHDWYREGARMLVNTQNFAGSWPPDAEFVKVLDKNVSTSFSLMFLSKGRWPVVVAHLKHEPAQDWNRHRGAIFNLLSYVEKVWERNLTFQVVDVAVATTDELLESPVLYLSGREAPRFSDEEKQKLRAYVEHGGFIFAVQNCAGAAFDQGFRALMKELFPEPEMSLQPLPADHPVWYMEEKVGTQDLPDLWGIDVSCRTGVIYSTQDLSCCWELARAWRENSHSDAVQQKIQAARAIGLNVLAYATDREVRYKDPTEHTKSAEDPNKGFERGKLQLAYVCHPGACSAAKAALFNLLTLATNQFRINCNPEPRKVRLSDPDLFEYQLLFLQGRDAFSLKPEEAEHVRRFVARGGTIFADALRSSTRFTETFRQEMKRVFPQASWEQIPPSHPLFSNEFGGEEIRSVEIRQPRMRDGDQVRLSATTQRSEPYLEGLKIDNAYPVIFSPYDISCALSKQATAEYQGYSRVDAAKIAINVMFYTLLGAGHARP